MVSSQASCTPTTICTAVCILHDVRQKHIDAVPLHVARHNMCTKKLVLQTWQNACLTPRFPLRATFFILHKPYVSYSVKVDLSPSCASRRKAWHLAPASRKDSDISNTDISSTQAWRQTWWRCHLDPNVSRHHRSTRMSENNPAPEPDELRSIHCFTACSKCIGGCHITQQLWTQRTQYV